MLWHITWTFIGMLVAGAVILVAEGMKEQKQQSALVSIVAASIIIVSLVVAIVTSGTAPSMDLDVTQLEFNEAYYLHSMVPIPNDNTKINLVVTRYDISKNVLEGPVIMAIIGKDMISSNVQPEKYIIKNSQGKFETWSPPKN